MTPPDKVCQRCRTVRISGPRSEYCPACKKIRKAESRKRSAERASKLPLGYRKPPPEPRAKATAFTLRQSILDYIKRRKAATKARSLCAVVENIISEASRTTPY